MLVLCAHRVQCQKLGQRPPIDVTVEDLDPLTNYQLRLSLWLTSVALTISADYEEEHTRQLVSPTGPVTPSLQLEENYSKCRNNKCRSLQLPRALEVCNKVAISCWLCSREQRAGGGLAR